MLVGDLPVIAAEIFDIFFLKELLAPEVRG
jgi:hypothetical protein